MKSLQLTFMGLSVALLAGCATYDAPAADEPHASANFYRSAGEGGNIMTQGRLLSYFVATEQSCRESDRVAFFGTGDLSGDQKSVRLPVDEPVTIIGSLIVNDAGIKDGVYQRVGQNSCDAVIRFTPKNADNFDIKYIVNDSGCTLQINDKDSGAAPSDLISGTDICLEN